MLGFVLGVALAMAGGAPAATLPAQTVASADMTAAEDWLRLIDQQRWDESWSAASILFRSQIPQARWAATIRPVREPLGPLASRTLKARTKAASLPGAPDGDYEILLFQTSFAQKKEALETVVLAFEASNWKVAGYFIR